MGGVTNFSARVPWTHKVAHFVCTITTLSKGRAKPARLRDLFPPDKTLLTADCPDARLGLRALVATPYAMVTEHDMIVLWPRKHEMSREYCSRTIPMSCTKLLPSHHRCHNRSVLISLWYSTLFLLHWDARIVSILDRLPVPYGLYLITVEFQGNTAKDLNSVRRPNWGWYMRTNRQLAANATQPVPCRQKFSSRILNMERPITHIFLSHKRNAKDIFHIWRHAYLCEAGSPSFISPTRVTRLKSEQ